MIYISHINLRRSKLCLEQEVIFTKGKMVVGKEDILKAVILTGN
jgi:hypothetical protein